MRLVTSNFDTFNQETRDRHMKNCCNFTPLPASKTILLEIISFVVVRLEIVLSKLYYSFFFILI